MVIQSIMFQNCPKNVTCFLPIYVDTVKNFTWASYLVDGNTKPGFPSLTIGRPLQHLLNHLSKQAGKGHFVFSDLFSPTDCDEPLRSLFDSISDLQGGSAHLFQDKV